MGGPDDQPPDTVKVPNPHYQDLQDLKTAVTNAEASLSNALKSANKKMQDGSAWTGQTTAKNFAADLSGRDKRLPKLVNQILAEVNHQLKITPSHIEKPATHGGRNVMIPN